MGFLITGCAPLSDTICPSLINTSSLARTVPSFSHQLTSTSLYSAKPFSNSFEKIH
jgi:hypothetical protein